MDNFIGLERQQDSSATGTTGSPMKRNRTKPPRLALISAAVFLAAIALFAVDPAQSRFLPACPIHSVTGLYCPGCGSTRALHQLAHGRVEAAMRLNLLVILMLPVVGLAAARSLWRRVRRVRTPAPTPRAVWIWMLATLIVLFGIARNIPVPSLDILKPKTTNAGGIIHEQRETSRS